MVSEKETQREHTGRLAGAKAGRGHGPFGRSGGVWEKGESYTDEDERPGLNVPPAKQTSCAPGK